MKVSRGRVLKVCRVLVIEAQNASSSIARFKGQSVPLAAAGVDYVHELSVFGGKPVHESE